MRFLTKGQRACTLRFLFECDFLHVDKTDNILKVGRMSARINDSAPIHRFRVEPIERCQKRTSRNHFFLFMIGSTMIDHVRKLDEHHNGALSTLFDCTDKLVVSTEPRVKVNRNIKTRKELGVLISGFGKI